MIFGSTFVVMKDAVADADPVPFVAARFLIAAAVLIPLVRRRPPESGAVAAGTRCGAALCAGYLFQVVGLQYVTSSVSAFITYLLVIFVPLLTAIRSRRVPDRLVIAAVGIAVPGLLLLTGAEVRLGRGELLTVGCAVAFAVHIVMLSDVSPRFSTARLNAVQFAVVGGICAVPGAFLGGYRFTAQAWWAALFTGVVASALALGLQVWAQRVVGPTRTSLLLLIEPVAAAGFGYLVGDRLGARGIAGAMLILLAVGLAELPATWRGRDRYDAGGAH